MDDRSTGQVTQSAAEIYETFFLPALFAQWPPHIAEAAGLASGQTVLDVACGTGVLAIEAARRVAPNGRVAGLDRNPGMLDVARRKASEIDWQEGMAEALPFADASMDRVVSQFGLMFFEDRAKAMAEMWRVLKPGGRLAVATYARAERSPGYAAMIGLLDRLFGREIAAELEAPFVLGDAQTLAAPFLQAGIGRPEIAEVEGEARFPSLEAWVHTDVKGWTLADKIDEAQFLLLRQAAEVELARFAGPDGVVRFASPALFATLRKPG
jgi:ubiquinone/menaquinone biosynthesis C-methylase UbiE